MHAGKGCLAEEIQEKAPGKLVFTESCLLNYVFDIVLRSLVEGKHTLT